MRTQATAALVLFVTTGTLRGADEAPPTEPAGVALRIIGISDLDPRSAETPLTLTVKVTNRADAQSGLLECDIMDYWFRSSYVRVPVPLKKNEAKDVRVDLDKETRRRLFRARHESGTNVFAVYVSFKRDGAVLARTGRGFHFVNRVKRYEVLPALEPEQEHVDDVFGTQRLVDRVRCFDPADPHPYIEGGRGLGSKYAGGVPQFGWKELFRETNRPFTTVETVLGKKCRVARGWGWFGYKLNRKGLAPGKPYLVVIEYPQDVGRSYKVWNTGSAYGIGGDYGFHTGKTLGDHWTRAVNAEYVDYPLTGRYERWYSFFHLANKVWAPGEPRRQSWSAGVEGFWVIVGGVGPSMDPLSAGAAVRTISLYEIQDVRALLPRVRRPPLELGRRQIFSTSESTGRRRFPPAQRTRWAKELLAETSLFGMTGLAPNGTRVVQPLLEANRKGDFGLKILPRVFMQRDIFGKMNPAEDARAIAADGRYNLPPLVWGGVAYLPDILHPTVLSRACTLIDGYLSEWTSYPELAGAMLFKHYGAPIMISFSDRALRLFEKDTGARIGGKTGQQRRDWVIGNAKGAYYRWWFGKKREFLLAIRDHLHSRRPDLRLFYFAWHSDDDFPFSSGRLRYSGRPWDDKVYVPGTNILLVPSFTVPLDEWTEAERRRAAHHSIRGRYREKVAPALQDRITLEDIVYGRQKDMKEFWGAKRSGEMPHLVYPHEMDLVRMFTEPGTVYTNGIGDDPRLYRGDKGFVYWAPVHYRYTADNPAFLNLFRTGEGLGVANHFPYNEATGARNCYNLMAATGVEHGGRFSMMEEVLAMAHADPVYLMAGMWLPVKRGFPSHARAFSAAFLALPAVPSQVLKGAAQPADPDIVVRSYQTEYGTYVAVINKAFDLKDRTVTLTLDAGPGAVAQVTDLVSGRAVPHQAVGPKRLRFAVRTEPMTLRSFHLKPTQPLAAFRDVQVTRHRFSPNGDGVQDEVMLTGRATSPTHAGSWTCTVSADGGRPVRRTAGRGPLRVRWDGRDTSGRVVPDGRYRFALVAEGLPKAVHRRAVVEVRNAPPPPPTIAPDTPRVVRYNAVDITGRADARRLRIRFSGRELERAVGPGGVFALTLTNLRLGRNDIEILGLSPTGVLSRPVTVSVTLTPEWLAADASTLFLADYTKGVDATFAKGDPKATAVNVTRSAEGVRIGEGAALSYATPGNLNLQTGSVEMWVKPEWDGDAPLTAVLFSQYHGTNHNRQFFRILKHTNALLYGACNGTATRYAAARVDITDWKANTWHFIKLVWAPGTIRLSVDGRTALEAPLTPKHLPTQAEPRFWIGGWKQWNQKSYWQRGWGLSVFRQVRISAVPR